MRLTSSLSFYIRSVFYYQLSRFVLPHVSYFINWLVTPSSHSYPSFHFMFPLPTRHITIPTYIVIFPLSLTVLCLWYLYRTAWHFHDMWYRHFGVPALHPTFAPPIFRFLCRHPLSVTLLSLMSTFRDPPDGHARAATYVDIRRLLAMASSAALDGTTSPCRL